MLCANCRAQRELIIVVTVRIGKTALAIDTIGAEKTMHKWVRGDWSETIYYANVVRKLEEACN